MEEKNGHNGAAPDEATGDHAAIRFGDEIATEASTQRRLIEADALVRAGSAIMDDQAIRLPIPCDDSCDVSVLIPLPPIALVPKIDACVSSERIAKHKVEEVVRQLTIRLEQFLPGQVVLQETDDAVSIQWTPTPDALDDATGRARAVAEHVAESLDLLGAGKDAIEVVRHLSNVLSDHQTRAHRLSTTRANHALIRSLGVGLFHIVGHAMAPDGLPALMAIQRDVDLLAPSAGRGLYLALRFPEIDMDERDVLSVLLADVLSTRCDIPLVSSDELTLFSEWEDLSTTCVFAGTPSKELTFNAFLEGLEDILRFSRSYIDFVWHGRDPFGLLGTSFATASARLARDGEDGQPVDAGGKLEVGWNRDLEKQAAAQFAAAQADSAEPDEGEVNIDKMSAREVVQRIQAAQAAVHYDVFLVHPGYNLDKTRKIMSIVLSITPEEAAEKCESAPCQLAAGVTPSRAQQLKTVIEGTGARIRVHEEGEELDDSDEAEP